MKKEGLKYEQLIEILKNSTPEFRDEEVINSRVIRQIQFNNQKPRFYDLLIEFFFGWVYVGWVRKSMVAAAVFIITIFIYQQSLILKRIDQLPDQKIQSSEFKMSNYKTEVNNRIFKYKLSNKEVNENDIDRFIKSLEKLKLNNKELLEKVESDPELKKYLEMKMNEMK